MDKIHVLENICLSNRVRNMRRKLDRLPIKLGHKKVGKLGNQIACRRSIGYRILETKVSMGVIINRGELGFGHGHLSSLKENEKTS